MRQQISSLSSCSALHCNVTRLALVMLMMMLMLTLMLMVSSVSYLRSTVYCLVLTHHSEENPEPVYVHYHHIRIFFVSVHTVTWLHITLIKCRQIQAVLQEF